jgi:hypothetical protein
MECLSFEKTNITDKTVACLRKKRSHKALVSESRVITTDHRILKWITLCLKFLSSLVLTYSVKKHKYIQKGIDLNRHISPFLVIMGIKFRALYLVGKGSTTYFYSNRVFVNFMTSDHSAPTSTSWIFNISGLNHHTQHCF